MELSFRYSCNCSKKKELAFNRVLDIDYQRRLKEYINDIVDHAWDESDTEMLTLVTSIMGSLSGSGNIRTDPKPCVPSSLVLPEKGLELMILKAMQPSTNTCLCEQICSLLSIVIDAGLVELYDAAVNEKSLLEKLYLIKPFIGMFEEDTILVNFFIRSWKTAIHSYLPKVIEVLTVLFPKYIILLIDRIIDLNITDSKTLLLRKEFTYLSRCLTVPSSFYFILSHLVEKKHDVAQQLIIVCLKFLRSELSSKEFYYLFPLHLKPYAIVMNEIISPSDVDVVNLVEQLRKHNPKDYKILHTISPAFCSLASQP